MIKNQEIQIDEKLNLIIESIKEKKGKQITKIDLTGIQNSICDYFIICHGDSTTQVDALADGVQDSLKQKAGIRAFHVEGTDHCQWVLIDYNDILVHVFLGEKRSFYNLEELWADGQVDIIGDN